MNKNTLYQILLFLLTAALLFVITVESSKTKVPYGYIFLAVICYVTGGILRFYKDRTRYRTLIWICKILVVIGFLDMVLFLTFSIVQEKSAKTKILLLTSQIDRFEKDQQKLPSSLQELCPNYLEELPEIYVGFFSAKITYNLIESIVNPSDLDIPSNTNYTIGFDGYYGKFYYYNSLSREWDEEIRK